MSVEIFKGKYVTAEDANKYIDTTAFIRGCNTIADGLVELYNSKKDLVDAKADYTKEVLYLKNTDYEEMIDNNINLLDNTYNYMKDFSSKMQKALEKAIDAKQLELNEKAKAEDLKMINNNQSI